MSDRIRPITIASKYRRVTCGGCDAVILVDGDLPALADDPEWCNIDNHGDDCQTVARFQKTLTDWR